MGFSYFSAKAIQNSANHVIREAHGDRLEFATVHAKGLLDVVIEFDLLATMKDRAAALFPRETLHSRTVYLDDQTFLKKTGKPIRKTGRYSLCLSQTFCVFYQENSVLHAPVPLLSFTDAKPVFEEKIMAGRLRTMDTITLGHAPYTDPTDPDVFWLLPV